MDRLMRALVAVIAVGGALTMISVGLAIQDDRPPAAATPSLAAGSDLPADHGRMLGVMRAQPHEHHLEWMREDPDWRELRGPGHQRHLEDYQQDLDRMLGRSGPR